MGSWADLDSADLVMTGGTVHTVDSADQIAEAIAVTAGRVARVGTDEEVTCLIGPRTRVVRLGGRSVLPGINDSHLHGTWLGQMWPSLLIDQLIAPPSADAPARRVRLETSAQRRAAILRACQLLAPLGVTSYTEPGLGPGEDEGQSGCFGSAVLSDYADLAAEGRLNARVTALMLFGELDGPSSLPVFLTGLGGFTPPGDIPGWFHVSGVKIFADGIPPLGTAWTDEPYTGGGHGGLLIEGKTDEDREAALVAMIGAARAAGHQVGVHATGSRTTRVVVGALAAPGGGQRHYVIHGDLIHPETLARMAAAGIGLNTQPGLVNAAGGMLKEALGETVMEHAWPVGDALEARVPLCLSSDAPVLTPDWRQGVAAAMTRPEQRLTFAQALRGYTMTPAWQDGADSWKGSLEDGKVADLCVLETNLAETEPEALPQVPVSLTMVDGRIVHEL
ncbi:amidohydrolase family protein [Spongiactinospora sp. TRM90649]|uniref:amidohydrolase n=1 Tax=Spongiactinospora sp. TRM90649 TaxID=3031114 RepID=UPI0023F96B59|nr:amidohydrolase family protein [Spongiactinospora sp. TRM90649]MDF5758962.1 amidohydrolase family protein [Spongiactinospora sp. TRM90649]